MVYGVAFQLLTPTVESSYWQKNPIFRLRHSSMEDGKRFKPSIFPAVVFSLQKDIHRSPMLQNPKPSLRLADHFSFAIYFHCSPPTEQGPYTHNVSPVRQRLKWDCYFKYFAGSWIVVKLACCKFRGRQITAVSVSHLLVILQITLPVFPLRVRYESAFVPPISTEIFPPILEHSPHLSTEAGPFKRYVHHSTMFAEMPPYLFK